MQEVIFYITLFVAYTLQTITGFAGNMLAMPVGMLTIGLSTSIMVLNFCAFFNCGAVAVTNRASINWKEFGKMFAGMILFLFVGMWLDTKVSVDILALIYGIFVIGVGIKNVAVKEQRDLPAWMLILILAGAGLMQGMFVSGGAFLVIYAMQKLKDKDEFRTTLSLIWTVLNFIYAVIYIYQGYLTPQTGSLILIALPLTIVATFLGAKIVKRVKQETFIQVTNYTLLAIGLVMILRYFFL